MKILKNNLITFVAFSICKHCNSELELSADDIKTHREDSITTKTDYYYCCEVCKQNNFLTI